MQIGPEIRRFAAQGLGEQHLGADNADDLVKSTFAHRKTRVLRGLDALHILAERFVQIQTDNVATRHHQRGDLTVVQTKHIAHHLAFVLFDNARIRAFFQQRMNLFFSDDGRSRMPDADQSQQELRRAREQAYERSGNAGQPEHRARHNPRNRLGIRLADTFGHQLAEHDAAVGDDDDDERRGQPPRGVMIDADFFKPSSHWCRKGGFCDNAI